MNFTVAYSQFALADIREYHTYIYLRSCEIDVANQWREELMDQIDSLDTFPRRFPEFETKPYRKMTFENYLVLYRIENDTVRVCRVFYATMLPDNYGTIE